MNCPVCDGVRMREVEKDSVMIDICPNCKGVWLDRGELDKLISGQREFRKSYEDYDREHERRSYDNYDDERRKYPKYKKRRSPFDIFEDLFD